MSEDIRLEELLYLDLFYKFKSDILANANIMFSKDEDYSISVDMLSLRYYVESNENIRTYVDIPEFMNFCFNKIIEIFKVLV